MPGGRSPDRDPRRRRTPAAWPGPSFAPLASAFRRTGTTPRGPATRNRRPGSGLSHARNGVPAMSKQRQVFTTGQVAKICQVAPRTVSKWFDSGKLKGYRIPGSQDRRIPRDHLIRFLKDNGMPLGSLEQESLHKILIVGAEPLFIERLQDLLSEDDDYKYEVAHSGFEAGSKAHEFKPDTI